MRSNEKAHLRGAGFVKTKRANQTPVLTQSAPTATYSADAVIGTVSILEVWRAVGGGELRRGRGRAFWRNGDGYSVSIDPARGLWHDFVSGEGGGKLGLIRKALGCSQCAAYQWLADLAGIPLGPKLSPSLEQRRAYAKARQDAAEMAKLAGWWLESRREELEAQKLKSNGIEGPWDQARFERASSELWRLTQMDPGEILAAWANARQTNPAETGRLEAAGKAWQLQYDEAIERIVRPLIGTVVNRAS